MGVVELLLAFTIGENNFGATYLCSDAQLELERWVL
jgi:hypothetical protein